MRNLQKIKEKIKLFIPPIFLKWIKKCKKNVFEYDGDFISWGEASRHSSGYEKDDILKKVIEAREKVLAGKAVYERDSVIFNKIQYFWPVLGALLWVYAKEKRLSVLDFGGSLGTSYFQCLPLLKHIERLSWNIVEQKHFVEYGKTKLTDAHLHFYSDFDECIRKGNPDVILISSVLQYLENPYELISKINKNRVKYVILDRTTILEKKKDRITVQNVPEKIYPNTSYPAWFFNEEKLINSFKEKYEVVDSFLSIGNPIILKDGLALNKGYIFKVRENS